MTFQDRTGTAPGQEIVAAIAAMTFDPPCKPAFSVIDRFQAGETAHSVISRNTRRFPFVASRRARTGTAPHQQTASVA